MKCSSAALIVLVSTARLMVGQAPQGSRPSPQEQQCLASALPDVQRRALADAEAKLTECERLYAPSAILSNALGVVYEQEDRKPAAIEAFEKALALLPSFTAAKIHLGTLYAGAGKCEAAERLFRDAAGSTTDSGALVASGIGLAQCHDLPGSIKILEKALQSNPRSNAAAYNLALAHYRNNDFEAALDILTSLQNHEQAEDADLLYLKGKVLEGISGTTTSARGDARAESAAALSRACRLRPQEDACTDAALAMIHQESFNEAATLIEQTLPHLSSSVRLLSALGLARFRVGRYNDAIAAYSRAIEIDPRLEAPREGLGFLLYMTGNLERARLVVEEGIRSSPSGFYLPYLRALILYRQSPGLRSEALAAASASIEKNPAFAPAYFLRGKIRADQNDPAAALGDFQDAVRIDPKYPLPYYRMARIYTQMGRPSEAADAARKFSSLGSLREDEVLSGQAREQLSRGAETR